MHLNNRFILWMLSSYYPDFNSQIKVKVQNLLGQDQEVTQSDIAVRTREVGTGISVAYKYDF